MADCQRGHRVVDLEHEWEIIWAGRRYGYDEFLVMDDLVQVVVYIYQCFENSARTRV